MLYVALRTRVYVMGANIHVTADHKRTVSMCAITGYDQLFVDVVELAGRRAGFRQTSCTTKDSFLFMYFFVARASTSPTYEYVRRTYAYDTSTVLKNKDRSNRRTYLYIN